MNSSDRRALLRAARPVVALPIAVRSQLKAIALYGSHERGEDLDPDEIRIGGLAAGASAASDHLEAEELRRQIAVLLRNQKS